MLELKTYAEHNPTEVARSTTSISTLWSTFHMLELQTLGDRGSQPPGGPRADATFPRPGDADNVAA
jgi:hypothetical protein